MQYFPSSPTSIAICSKCRSSTRSSLVRSCLESRSRSQRRFANRCELHWLPVHKRIVYKLCLMSTQAGPNIPVVTFFAALNCHNASSAAGSNPQIFYYGTGEHELSHMAHICSFWTYMLELPSIISETRSFLANVNAHVHVRYMPSSVCLPVVCLSIPETT